ncbi:V-type ATP synthase subunit C [Gudongella oleilytica]|uniref:V-type ATP synthase subunit C n=1 Tax=Gudongella oleilytica TaxID=1582259 RepID=UPI002A36BC9A|nr:V-type ATP synthase subunit C [Gudongella oleilytica]MDY0255941.1 V-type ATP synthase subunit C [Gudongella oleilytica]
MDRMDFIQGVTRIRVLENKLLDRAAIEKMVEARDLEEVFRTLGDTEYASAVTQAGKPEEYEVVLHTELERVYRLVREISPDSLVVDLMALKYDFHNLKVMIKERLMGKDLSAIYSRVGTIDFEKFKTQFTAGEYRDMEPVSYKEAVLSVLKDFEEKKDPQRIDILMDRYYFEHLHKMAKDSGISLFQDHVKDLIDFTNVSSAIRLKKQDKELKFFEEVILENGHIEKDTMLSTVNDSVETMINRFRNSRISKELSKGLEDYLETGRLSSFEKHMDNYLMNLNKSSKSVTFGPEPLFSYLVAKEMEIKILRIIMVSKMNNISPDAIRERLRDLYV